jgi:hypothetical protein
MSKYQYFASVSALLLMTTHAMSQANLDNLLATVSVDKKGKCSIVDIRLNRPASYLHHFPANSGNSLSISIEPLGITTDNVAGVDTTAPDREAASVPVGNSAGLDGVSFDPDASGGPEIRLSFAKNVAFHVVMDTNTRHLRVDVAEPAHAQACFGKAAAVPSSTTEKAGKGDSAAVGNTAEASLAEGKSQLAGKDYARATAFFTKTIAIGSGKVRQEAQELLGLARERAGQLPHAQAEYQAYLKAYPNGAGASRVRARLQDVRAAMDQAAEQQFAERRGKQDLQASEKLKPATLKLSQVVEALTGASEQSTKSDAETPDGPIVVGGLHNTGQGLALDAKEPVKDPNAWTWEHSGSLAQYYYRNDNFRSSDPAAHNFGMHQVYQNEIVSSADGFLHGENQDYEMDLRSSLFNEKGFGQQSDIKSTNIGSLYVDLKSKDTGLSTRLGRQSKSTGGVFGRFDGALLGWQVNKEMKLQAYSGSPVYRRDAKPFADDRIFYGASVDYTFPGDQWAGALYAMAQDLGSIIDRRAVGAELRYTSKELSVYTAGDFDVFYKELNNAYVSANWHVREGTNVYASADYRRVPFLLTENALMGQNVEDLETLVSIWGEDNVYQFALDRTASARTINGGVSQDINQDWQFSLDGTVAEYSGTPASGGVDAIPPPGVEYYASASLNGANLLREGDSATFGLRYSGSKTSNFYMADAYYRIPINENWRLSPRIRFSMRDSKTADQKIYQVVPSIASRYRLNKKWSFESELGLTWEDIVTSLSATQTLNVRATAGYRFEF